MERLSPLGLTPGWIYEALVCTYLDGSPHAIPVGVWTDDLRTLRMELYRSSGTLSAVTATGACVAELPADADMLFTALYAPEELRFGRAREVQAPCLPDASASLELTLTAATPRGSTVLLDVDVERITVRRPVRPINRAEGLLVESLILATRADRLGRAETLARLRENRRVVAKVAPGSPYAAAMARLLQALDDDS